MELKTLQERFSHTREKQARGVFASLFILQNQLHTAFDKGNATLTLKQFMLLVMIRQADKPLSLTELGLLLGCSRQNIKKLGNALVKKGFAVINKRASDQRTQVYSAAPGMEVYFRQAAGKHEKALAQLFLDYSDEELKTFYLLLMKLYTGTQRIQNMEEHVAWEKQ